MRYINDEWNFVETWSTIEAPEQRHATEHAINNGAFLGVARAIGSMRWYPMVETDGRSGPYIIDTDGNYQIAAIDGRRYFKR